MMASAAAYTAFAEQVLMPAMDQAVLAEIKALEAAGDIENPRYMELLIPHYYEHHTLRMPAGDWPDPAVRGFAHINPKIYVPMQGPSELGMSTDAKLARWDRVADLQDRRADAGHRGHPDPWTGPTWRRWRGAFRRQLPALPRGSHLALYDDQETYFTGLTGFLTSLPAAKA